MNGRELTALYTLQHRLPRKAEEFCGFLHGDMALGGLLDEACAKLIIDADAPWGTWGHLLTCYETVGEPAVEGGGGQSEDLGGLCDRDQFSVLRGRGGIESRDFPIAAEIADLVGGEPVSAGCAPALAVDDARDDAVGMMESQAADEFDGIFVCADGRSIVAFEREIKF